MLNLISSIGSKTINIFLLIKKNIRLFLLTISSVFIHIKDKQNIRPFFIQLNSQIYFTGIQGFVLILPIALILGFLIVYVSLNQMPEFGIVTYFSRILIDSIVVELSPLITALVIIGRSGTALTVLIGNMRVNKEINALHSMGISYVDYIVMPAFLSFVISLISLNFYFSIFAILGGLLFASISIKIPLVIFIMEIAETLKFSDIAIIIAKSFVYGTVISLVSCFYGLEVRNIRGVPKAIIKSVVTSVISLIIFSLIFAGLRYGIYKQLFLFR